MLGKSLGRASGAAEAREDVKRLEQSNKPTARRRNAHRNVGQAKLWPALQCATVTLLPTPDVSRLTTILSASADVARRICFFFITSVTNLSATERIQWQVFLFN